MRAEYWPALVRFAMGGGYLSGDLGGERWCYVRARSQDWIEPSQDGENGEEGKYMSGEGTNGRCLRGKFVPGFCCSLL